MTPSKDEVHEDAELEPLRIPVEHDEPHLPEEAPVEIAAPEAPADGARETWLTAEWSDAFGQAGHFHDLTAEEAAAAPEGVLVKPTAEQLAQRRR